MLLNTNQEGLSWVLKGLPPKVSFLALFFLLLFLKPVSAAPLAKDPIILPTFLIMAGISLFCLLIGMGARIPFFTIVGFIFVFVMGFVIQEGNLYLPAGNETLRYSYGNNFTANHWDYDYSNPPNFNPSIINTPEAVFLFHQYKTVNYQAWNYGNYRLFGWLLMMIGLFASVFNVFTTFRGEQD